MDADQTAGEILGYSDANVPRVRFGFASENDGIDVMLVATKGDVAATWDLFGKSGPDIGNRLYVARLLDLGIECALVTGAQFICNEPVDRRVKAIYEAMGFDDGERLDLANPDSVGAVCRFIDEVYCHCATELPSFTRPW